MKLQAQNGRTLWQRLKYLYHMSMLQLPVNASASEPVAEEGEEKKREGEEGKGKKEGGGMGHCGSSEGVGGQRSLRGSIENIAEHADARPQRALSAAARVGINSYMIN